MGLVQRDNQAEKALFDLVVHRAQGSSEGGSRKHGVLGPQKHVTDFLQMKDRLKWERLLEEWCPWCLSEGDRFGAK